MEVVDRYQTVQFDDLRSLILPTNHSPMEESEFKERQISIARNVSSLDFLAQASFEMNSQMTEKWSTSVSDGKEKLAIVPGPNGASIRLHKGTGRLPVTEACKSFTKKCRNRECTNLSGQQDKPRSVYCSKRCQSREQNLRQGRIKYVKHSTRTPSPDSEGYASSSSPSSSPTSHLNLFRTTPSPTFNSPNANFSPVTMSASLQSNNHITSPIFLRNSPTKFTSNPENINSKDLKLAPIAEEL